MDVMGSCPMRQRTDHIICFNALHAENGPSQSTHCGMNRLNLTGKLRGHRRTVRLIFWIDIVAKGLAFYVKDASRVIRLIVLDKFAHHVDYAVYCTCGFSLRVAQIRHGMKRPIEVTRSIH